ncbi:Scr1 family TA system antitoxin-like transcriptional regulator [Streptomyces sp. MK37H]|uniref:Scr1 family TA system antitoxin-like transcriptional regulator n=1 Tax=Streptomyces sp. MK37H TaxID=2699117 RepID=UPI0035A84327
MQRQSVLDRQVPLHRWVILDEAVLRLIVGDEAVMAEQMDHLPFTAGAHAAGSGHFVILGREDARNPLNSMAVVYIGMRRRGLYLDDVDALSSYKLSFDYLRSQAADSTTSLRLLGTVR